MFGLFYMSSVFKTMGIELGYIDDFFLTTVGSIGALSNGLSRFVWGTI